MCQSSCQYMFSPSFLITSPELLGVTVISANRKTSFPKLLYKYGLQIICKWKLLDITYESYLKGLIWLLGLFFLLFFTPPPFIELRYPDKLQETSWTMRERSKQQSPWFWHLWVTESCHQIFANLARFLITQEKYKYKPLCA